MIDLDCQRCRLYATRQHVCPGRGEIPAPVMVVGIGPGYQEDREGKCWVGPAGQLLDRLLEESGLTHVWRDNRVRCLLPGMREPEDDELAACDQWTRLAFDVVQPKVVVLLGLPAAWMAFPRSSFMHKITGNARAHGGRVWLPAPHPAAVLRGKTNAEDILAVLTRAQLEAGRCRGGLGSS